MKALLSPKTRLHTLKLACFYLLFIIYLFYNQFNPDFTFLLLWINAFQNIDNFIQSDWTVRIMYGLESIAWLKLHYYFCEYMQKRSGLEISLSH